MNEVKRCNECGQTKVKSEFPVINAKTGKSWLAAYCIPCDKARRSAYQKANRARCTANYRRWVERNPFKARITVMERQARYQWKKAALQVEKFSYFDVLDRDGWTCSICGDQVAECALSFDHTIPKSQGGPHTFDNVHVAHIRCNDSKAGKLAAKARWMNRGTDHTACHKRDCTNHSPQQE